MVIPEVLRVLDTTSDGLSSAEAARRLRLVGANALSSQERSFWSIAHQQFLSGINVLLGLAGQLTVAIGDLPDGVIILALVALNVGLSIFQEYRAELALAALRCMLPLTVHAMRDGSLVQLPSTELVPGDVIAVGTGDLVPADARLLDARDLEVNQAALTGESLSQPKSIAPVPKGSPTTWTNTLFAGTTVVAGEGRGVVIAVAVRALGPSETEPDVDRGGDVLLGLVAFADPPRPGAAAALARAQALQVQVKVVTGDAVGRAVALARQIGISASSETIASAEALRGSNAANAAERGVIFADVVPADKYRLVRMLQALGHHVGMTGDGVNDAPALSAADVGIALASGTDAARGASDLVLLQDDLGIIVDAVGEGRRLFTNVNHYLLYTMVSNFANVVVVAIASLFLPFLPLLPAQVLVLNVLADLPMLAIVTDRVSDQDLATPRRWDVRRIVDLTLYLGVLNALFAFALLRFLAGTPMTVIYSAWFLFLGTTALLILFPVRASGWFWRAPFPSVPLLLALGVAFGVTVLLVNLPWTQSLFHFASLSWRFQAGSIGYACIYVFVAGVLKRGYAQLTHAESLGAGRWGLVPSLFAVGLALFAGAIDDQLSPEGTVPKRLNSRLRGTPVHQ